MIPSEYDVGDARDFYAVGTGFVEGEPMVIISAWENGDDRDNLSCVALEPKDAASLARALIRAADHDTPDAPRGTVLPPSKTKRGLVAPMPMQRHAILGHRWLHPPMPYFHLRVYLMRKPARKSFTCEHCGADVPRLAARVKGTIARNSCTECNWSNMSSLVARTSGTSGIRHAAG